MATDDASPPPLRGRSVRSANREGGLSPAHRQVPVFNRGRAKAMRSKMTDAERHLWQRLRAHRLNGLSFRRQVPIGAYIVDFVCQDLHLIVELDGGQHGFDQEVARDELRSERLRSKGYRILRFWNSDVLRNCGAVTQSILEASTPHVSPRPSLTDATDDLLLKGRGRKSKRGTQP